MQLSDTNVGAASTMNWILSRINCKSRVGAVKQDNEKILVTGCAGFIGFHVAQYLLAQEFDVIGIDNINDYYSVHLKKDRLDILKKSQNFRFYEIDICDLSSLQKISNKYNFKTIIHMAAQPGVRYSITNPFEYVRTNVQGFLHILELARHIKHFNRLVYASSSSVYGNSKNTPFNTQDRTDHPISLYAATKKSDELMAYTYSHLYGLDILGLRFFTVYGPWGRPDMAAFRFTDSILKGGTIELYNYGNMKRDFTYINDIVYGVMGALNLKFSGHHVYNLGNNKPETLMDFLKTLEAATGLKANLKHSPIQPGDADETFADISDSTRDLGFRPITPISIGVPAFVDWYKTYYSFK